jgi:hypothetical protein
MPHQVTIVETHYSYEELSDSAKEAARDWYREGNLDYDWWEHIYSDVEEIGNLLGIERDRKPHGRGNGPCIWFSGFSSQGDGACFEGRYSYAKSCAKAVRSHAPQNTKLHRIADELQALQRKYFYRLEARASHSGSYYHSGCMSVDVSLRSGEDAPREAEDGIRQLLRDFADWIYRQLEQEHDWQQSDEQIAEGIIANEHKFYENGKHV